jgi:hypothetical protein
MAKLQIVEGDLLEARGPRRLLLATGHGQVGEKDLTLSMSAESARVLAEAYPEAPRTLGKLAWWRGIPMSGWHLYGLLVLEGYLTGEAIGLFQTKRRGGSRRTPWSSPTPRRGWRGGSGIGLAGKPMWPFRRSNQGAPKRRRSWRPWNSS